MPLCLSRMAFERRNLLVQSGYPGLARFRFELRLGTSGNP